jgi:hypothetical protein
MAFLRRSLLALGAIYVLLGGGGAQAYDVELRWGHVTTTWQRINQVLMSIAEKVAMDDDWLKQLADMKPAAGAGVTEADATAAIAAFRSALDRYNATHKVDPAQVHRPELAPDGSLAAAYLDSGYLLDAVILQVVKSDPVRVIGQYFPRFEDAGGGLAEAHGEIGRADARLKAIMTELGIE